MAMASAPPSEDHLSPKAPPPSAPPPPPPQGAAPPLATATPVFDYTNPIAYDTTTPNAGKTNSYSIQGKNKQLRDRAKRILAITAVCLLLNQNGWALVTSVLALFTLKRGTLFSHKNWKWLLLSAVSVAVSAAGYLWHRSEQKIDARRAYHMKTALWIVANWLSGFWGIVLGLFLVSALYQPEQLEQMVEHAVETVPGGKAAVRVAAAAMGGGQQRTEPAVTGLAPAVPDWSYHHHQKQQ